MPEVQQGVGGTSPGIFDQDKSCLLALTTEFRQSADQLDRKPHPIFGPLSTLEWMRWAFLHSDHHLRQFGL